MTYSQDIDVLRKQMRTKQPEEIVRFVLHVVRKNFLDHVCPVCQAKIGAMCVTIEGEPRSVIHEERRHV